MPASKWLKAKNPQALATEEWETLTVSGTRFQINCIAGAIKKVPTAIMVVGDRGEWESKGVKMVHDWESWDHKVPSGQLGGDRNCCFPLLYPSAVSFLFIPVLYPTLVFLCCIPLLYTSVISQCYIPGYIPLLYPSVISHCCIPLLYPSVISHCCIPLL